MTESRSRIWPEVTSPAARRVVEYLFNYRGAYTDSDVAEKVQQLEVFRRWFGLGRLMQRVANSDLAQRLAGGPALLPDIAAALPPFHRAVYRLFRPRTLEQQVDLLVRHLEWYLDPNQPVLSSSKPASRLSAPLFVLLVAIAALLIIAGNFGGSAGAMLTLLGLLAVVAVATVYGVMYHRRAQRIVNFADQPSASRNATVLYHHLRQAYADADEP